MRTLVSAKAHMKFEKYLNAYRNMHSLKKIVSLTKRFIHQNPLDTKDMEEVKQISNEAILEADKVIISFESISSKI